MPMFPLDSMSKLLTAVAESTITLTNIFVQFPMAVAYKAALHR